jgi:hypothetical protein
MTTSKPKPKGRHKKYKCTPEELAEIRARNKKVLDDIFSDENWREKLGTKYYGKARWQKIFFGEDHPEYWDWRMNPNREKSSDTNRRVIELDLDGNTLNEFENIKEVLELYDWPATRGILIMDCARNKAETAYGRKWEFGS